MPVKPPVFQVKSATSEGIVEIHAAGSITEESVGPLRDAIAGALAAGSVKIALCFAEVDYIASAGIGMLVTMLKRARSARAELAICALRPEIRELFELTRLNLVFTLAESIASGRKALAGV